ncbi:MAG: hypothetical protein WAW91_01870 [Candidatus Nanoperiomorbaceae bacterium]
MIRPSQILLVEDDNWLADSLAKNLCREFTVTTVADPAAVFGEMNRCWPVAIVADVLLGEQNLFVLLNEMQSYTDLRVVPIIILSSVASRIRLDDVREFGVRQVLDKTTITPTKLRAAVRSVIDDSVATGKGKPI